MNVTLYSTHCPKCNILETKLKQKNIQFTEVNDVEIMGQKGFEFAPMLEVDEQVMGFKEAVDWVKEQ